MALIFHFHFHFQSPCESSEAASVGSWLGDTLGRQDKRVKRRGQLMGVWYWSVACHWNGCE